MPNYRRILLDQPVFITCITYKRLPVFNTPESIELFWEVVGTAQKIHPFEILAYVLLPEHFHWMIKTKSNTNISKVMQSVKGNFSYLFGRLKPDQRNEIWQKGFWDHIIRDDKDYYNHLDYIHFNPVKHGYVDLPQNWEQSSLRRWIDDGHYDFGWGSCNPESSEKWNYE